LSDPLELATRYEGEGLFEEAIGQYRRAIEAGEADCDTYLRCATLHRERGRPVEARAVFEAAIERFPDNPWPRHRLGELLGQNGRQGAGLRRMYEAYALAPNGEEFLVNIAATASHLQRLDEAYAAARKLRPDLGDWWAGARRTALERYVAERSETLKLLAARPEPLTAAWLWELGPRLVRLGRLRLAERVAAALIADAPQSWPAYYLMADVIQRREGPDAAATYLRAHPVMQGDLLAYTLRLARLLHEAGRFAELLDVLDASGLPSDNEELRWLRFMALFLSGSTDRLRDYCSRWLQESPFNLTPAATLAALRHHAQTTPWKGGQVTLVRPHLAQFWDKTDVPPDVRGVMLSWTRLNPELGYTLFDDSSARRFLETHYGAAIVQLYDACHHPAMKADYFRIAFLHHSGGLWVDADEVCLRPLGYVIDAAEDAEIIAMLDGDTPGYVHNSFLGSRPRSRIVRAAVEEATLLVAQQLQQGRRPDIWGVTGPGLITRAIGRYLASTPAAWEGEEVLLLGRQQYGYFAQKVGQLAYKHDAAKNWNML
jgi:Tfp pilus assembly protein PilF